MREEEQREGAFTGFTAAGLMLDYLCTVLKSKLEKHR